MMKILLSLILIIYLAVPVNAFEFTAPTVPQENSDYLPEEPETFAQGLTMILKEAMRSLRPSLAESVASCVGVIVLGIFLALLKMIPGAPESTLELSGTVCIAGLLLKSSDTLIRLGTQTIEQLSNYGKMLIPVLTTALAAQGGATTSAALCTGTIMLDTILSAVISSFIVPLLYMYLCLSIASAAISQPLLGKVKGYIKSILTWLLKMVIYIFTGYLGITGVVSGTTDAAALKATKLTISGMVPVVGGLVSDASEAILVGAGVMKSAAGVYGVLALLAVCAGPFIRIGAQYIVLKVTGLVFDVFEAKRPGALLEDVTSAMGLVMGMTGTVCLLLMISIICFMKGVG